MNKPKTKPLEPLSSRTTRVKLLLATYKDVCIAGRSEGESGSKTKPGSKAPRRDPVFFEGSYKALERSLDRLREEHRTVFFNVWRFHVDGIQRSGWYDAAKVVQGFQRLCELMPENVYVPAEVSENAGYNAGEAKAYSWRTKQAA